ncbi:hypothetical protein [Rhodococcus marinonascens]|uniref:hypothetical protein n=1 Tax=Rhodococcus marinonascens TaxID=38311 RepID=UPI00111477E9|nr:hypothetical protein [Rhodococcus marinonascens]
MSNHRASSGKHTAEVLKRTSRRSLHAERVGGKVPAIGEILLAAGHSPSWDSGADHGSVVAALGLVSMT